jgi:hypothetical protein
VARFGIGGNRDHDREALGRRALPEQFEQPEWRARSDGGEYRWRSRTLEVDPLAQRLTMEVQASMRRGGEVLQDETYILP